MIRLLLIAGGLMAAAPAGAHGTLAGGGAFYAAAMHPFIAFEHLMLLLGLGLLLGRGPQPDRVSLASLALGLAAGLAIGASGASWGAGAIPAAVLIAGVATGLGLAAAFFPPRPVLRAAAAVIGLLIGMDTDGPTPAGADALSVWPVFGGVFVGAFLLVLNAMALSHVAVRPPFSIGVRVAGSWIAAFGVLVLALEFRRLGGAA